LITSGKITNSTDVSRVAELLSESNAFYDVEMISELMNTMLQHTFNNAINRVNAVEVRNVMNQLKAARVFIPQLQGKIEAFNKIVKNEFLALEDIPSMDDGKLRYDMFVKAYNEAREHGGINGLTPSEMFLQRLITSTIDKETKQQSVTHVGNQKCNLSE